MKSSDKRWLEALQDLRTWKRGATRAVHKPLLLLLILGRASRNLSNEFPFEELENPLTSLLREFGPSRKTYHPEFPFWHLRHDGFWHLQNEEPFGGIAAGSSPSKGSLVRNHAVGHVNHDLWQVLVDDAELQERLTSHLLEEFWPSTLHDAIRNAVGLPAQTARVQASRKRDPRFREDVLLAYRSVCAVCAFDGRLGGNPLGLQAAHVMWHALGGPDDVSNGLALCPFHHLALDSGAMGLSADRRVIISSRVTGNNRVDELLYRFEGKEILEPQPGSLPVDKRHLEWHRKQVFKKPARYWPTQEGDLRAAAEPDSGYDGSR